MGDLLPVFLLLSSIDTIKLMRSAIGNEASDAVDAPVDDLASALSELASGSHATDTAPTAELALVPVAGSELELLVFVMEDNRQ